MKIPQVEERHHLFPTRHLEVERRQHYHQGPPKYLAVAYPSLHPNQRDRTRKTSR
jgi:hypothetical protein